MTDGVQPITPDERRARIEKARRLMAAQKIGAIFMERGTTMFYFTGTRDVSGLMIPAKGDVVWVVPSTEEQRAHDGSKVGGKIVTYASTEQPFAVLKQALKDNGVTGGNIGFEEQVRFAVSDGLCKELPHGRLSSAPPGTTRRLSHLQDPRPSSRSCSARRT